MGTRAASPNRPYTTPTHLVAPPRGISAAPRRTRPRSRDPSLPRSSAATPLTLARVRSSDPRAARRRCRARSPRRARRRLQVLAPPPEVKKTIASGVDKKAALQRVVHRWEWTRQEAAKRKAAAQQADAERIAFQSVDWHDFVVVEQIDFPEVSFVSGGLLSRRARLLFWFVLFTPAPTGVTADDGKIAGPLAKPNKQPRTVVRELTSYCCVV